jgi:hypothetical protein
MFTDWYRLIASLEFGERDLQRVAFACVRAVWQWIDLPKVQEAVEVAERALLGTARRRTPAPAPAEAQDQYGNAEQQE